LAQIYTEGLFVGAAFGCLALVRRKQWIGAGLLAALATWTRAAGVALIIPLALVWLQEFDGKRVDRTLVVRSLAVIMRSPRTWYGVFSAWGQAFSLVERI